MKPLFSYVAALAATTSLSLILPITARAASYAATTIPNPSGAVTCTGTNPDGSAATWTEGGFIYYIHSYSAHSYDSHGTSLGWYSIVNDSGSPNSTYGEYQVVTSSNVKPSVNLNMTAYLSFLPYPGTGSVQTQAIVIQLHLVLGSGQVFNSPAFSYADLKDVKSVQYKVACQQNGAQATYVAATPTL